LTVLSRTIGTDNRALRRQISGLQVCQPCPSSQLACVYDPAHLSYFPPHRSAQNNFTQQVTNLQFALQSSEDRYVEVQVGGLIGPRDHLKHVIPNDLTSSGQRIGQPMHVQISWFLSPPCHAQGQARDGAVEHAAGPPVGR
jgi:hypothetical protein